MCERLGNKHSNNLNFICNTHKTPTQSYLNALIGSKVILDSGATNHYLKSNIQSSVKQPVTFGPIVHLPDGTSMQATHDTKLNIPSLSEQGSKAYIFPQLKTANLLSVGQFCDDE